MAALYEGVPLDKWVFGNLVGLTAVILASISLVMLWYLMLFRGKIRVFRILAGFQVTMILLAISYAHFPDFIIFKSGENLALYDQIAPEKTVLALGNALLIGSLFILPALFYLFYSFKKKDREELVNA